MPAYEAMFIFRPGLKEEEQKALVAALEDTLKKNQASIKSSAVFGRRQLAFAVKKNNEGLYYLMTFSASTPEAVVKLRRACSINENVLRVLVTKKVQL